MSRNILTGLVGAWCPSLGPSGYTLLDRSGRGQHMSITGASSSFWGASGGSICARSRKGSESASTALLNSGLAASVPWTFGCWANIYEDLSLPVFCGFGVQLPVGAGSVGRYWLNYLSVYYLWGGANDWNTGVALGLNAWRHVIWSYDGTTTRLHINGVQAASTNTYTPSTQATYATVFNKHSSAASSVNADINDFGIWSRALTASEIRSLYTLGIGGLGRLLTQRTQRRVYRTQAAVKSYLFSNRGQVIGGGTL